MIERPRLHESAASCFWLGTMTLPIESLGEQNIGTHHLRFWFMVSCVHAQKMQHRAVPSDAFGYFHRPQKYHPTGAIYDAATEHCQSACNAQVGVSVTDIFFTALSCSFLRQIALPLVFPCLGLFLPVGE